MMSTRKEIRENIQFTCRETQIASRIDEFINLTIDEIQNPSWAFLKTRFQDYHHLWRANRRKYTLTTEEDVEDYQLPRDVDEIGFFRQTTSPIKLIFVPDRLFYKWIPNPTAEGNPRFYRLWEEYGVEVQLTTAEIVTIVSDNADDDATVIVIGTDADGYELIESFTLDGTNNQTGLKTFTTIRQVSKSEDTTGKVTVIGATTGTIVTLLPQERSPRFKRVSFYPIPSSEISIYLEYYTQFRHLETDTDVPDFDSKWHWIVRTGALAKVYQYQNKEIDMNLAQQNFAAGVRSMVKADLMNVDHIPMLKGGRVRGAGIVELSDSIIGTSGFVPYW